MKKTKPILYDPLIINRVKQYLEENVHQTYLDVGVMSKALQERYPEYSRRKIAPFRSLVEQAYKVVSQSYGLDITPPSPDSGSDLEVMDDTPAAANSMNNMLTNLYSKKPTKSGSSGNNELIDISSEESDQDNASANGKSKESQPDPVAKFGEITVRKVVPPEGGKSSSSSDTTGPVIRSTTPTLSKKRKRGRSQSPANSNSNSQTDFVELTPTLISKDSNSASLDSAGAGPTVLPMRRPKGYKKEVRPTKPRENFQDVGGMENVLKELCEILMHVKQPDIYFMLGLMPPRGLLLHGPPGCGKTLLAHAIAGQLGLNMIEVPATELISGVTGESEERIRDVFEQTMAYAPCVLFIDEVDAISSNRSSAQRDMERRIVSQLISSLDSLKINERGQSVLVIGATTRPDAVDPGLRRVARFDHEIAIGIPNRKDRREILTIVCEGLSINPKFDFDQIAELTPGYVGADMLALVSRAATIAVKRKCAKQMRELQLKSQRNITIVDLVDEGQTEETGAAPSEETPSTSAGQAKKDEQSKAKSPATTTETTPEVVSQLPKEAEKEAAASTTTPTAKDGDSTGVSEKSDTIGSAKEPEPERMDVEESESAVVTEPTPETVINEEPIDVDELPEVREDPDPESIPELTLFEMINMLDNAIIDTQDITDFFITLDDFKAAVKLIKPSAKREGFITIPDVTWDDVGSLQDIREELKLAVLAPVKFPEKLDKLGLTAPSGVLLCGPPGCGKTLLAKAIANEAGINFISVKGPEMMNMYVGESERAVRACFQRARNSAPCVIFFDEFDSLCPKRSDNYDSGSGTRIVNQLLTEMDGVEDRKGVYILAATNRPDIIDPAILRPGRLDTILYVGLPQRKDRHEILIALTKNRKKPVLNEDVDLEFLAEKTEGYTGADLAGLVRQAAILALKESINKPDTPLDDLCVKASHFKKAISQLRPSVNAQDQKMYEKLKEKYAAPRIPDEDE